jgi:O-antigen/teichoic acid export membrane protein
VATDSTKNVLIFQRVVRNILSNYAGAIISLGTGFFLTPFILHQLGPSDFGLWALVGTAMIYGSLLDFGIGGAVVKYVAEYSAKGEFKEARSLVATALCLYTALGLIIITVIAGIALFVPKIVDVPPDQGATFTWLMLLVGLKIGISIPCTTAMAVLRGLQRYDIANLINSVGTILSAVATLITLLLGGGVLGLMGVSIAVMIAMQGWAIWFIRTMMPQLHFGWRRAKRRMVRTLVSFSSSLFVTEFSGCLQTKTDEFVIAASLSISAVAPYAIARRLSELAQLLTDQVMKVILPLASELHAEDDRARLRSLYFISTRLTLAAFLPVGSTLIVLSKSILTAWVGAAYANHAHLVIILTLASLITTSMWPAAAIIQSMTRHRPLAAMSLGSGLANFALSVALVHRFGLTGVALGTLIPTAVECLGFVLPYTTRVIGVNFSEIGEKILLPALLPVIPMVITLYFFQWAVEPSSLIAIFVVIAPGVLVYVLGYLYLGANKLERQICWNFALGTMHLLKLGLKFCVLGQENRKRY